MTQARATILGKNKKHKDGRKMSDSNTSDIGCQKSDRRKELALTKLYVKEEQLSAKLYVFDSCVWE